MGSTLQIPSRHLDMNHNVTFIVRDAVTMQPVQISKGHNASTNSLLTGIGHYLTGEGILNQGYHMLSDYIPRYLSLGTMGLGSQEADIHGYPKHIGGLTGSEEERCKNYLMQCPGFGADGYDENTNNNRPFFGLGPKFANRQALDVVNCELVSDSFPRVAISYRDVVPETEAEFPKTIDVVFSAMVSTGALKEFRGGRDYVFITEAGLWSRSDWVDGGDNGLLAGYRLAPSDQEDWDMSNPDNIDLLKRSILRVGVNQVVQVIWKIQLGGIEQLGGLERLYPSEYRLFWNNWK